MFKFTKDEAQLKNNLRHQVFACYYDPCLFHAFNSIMMNVKTTKVDVMDITPKINFPYLMENILNTPSFRNRPVGNKKKIFLNHHTILSAVIASKRSQKLDPLISESKPI